MCMHGNYHKQAVVSSLDGVCVCVFNVAEVGLYSECSVIWVKTKLACFIFWTGLKFMSCLCSFLQIYILRTIVNVFQISPFDNAFF